MKVAKLQETNNGYIVVLDGRLEYVFKYTELKEMLEFIGKYVHGRKVKVELQ